MSEYQRQMRGSGSWVGGRERHHRGDYWDDRDYLDMGEMHHHKRYPGEEREYWMERDQPGWERGYGRERERRGMEERESRASHIRKGDRAMSDVGELKWYWIARIEVPGVKKDDIDLILKGNKLKVRARRDKRLLSEDKFDRKNLQWIKKESTSKFKRIFYFPTEIKEKHISARIRDGILEILIKKPKAYRKSIRGASPTRYHMKSKKKGRKEPVSVESCEHPSLFRSSSPVVFEHIHHKKVVEEHIPHVHPIEILEEHHQVVMPIERVEVHKHIHPQERLEVHEHVHPRERIDVHEHVRPIITTEVHEHIHPEVIREVHKDIYPAEVVKKEHKDIDLGEVERKVIEKDVGKVSLGKEKKVLHVTEKEGSKEGHHHHHKGEHVHHHGHEGKEEKHRVELKSEGHTGTVHLDKEQIKEKEGEKKAGTS